MNLTQLRQYPALFAYRKALQAEAETIKAYLYCLEQGGAGLFDTECAMHDAKNRTLIAKKRVEQFSTKREH
jgi:hypothetical protein